jgi:hypothetical protein
MATRPTSGVIPGPRANYTRRSGRTSKRSRTPQGERLKTHENALPSSKARAVAAICRTQNDAPFEKERGRPLPLGKSPRRPISPAGAGSSRFAATHDLRESYSRKRAVPVGKQKKGTRPRGCLTTGYQGGAPDCSEERVLSVLLKPARRSQSAHVGFRTQRAFACSGVADLRSWAPGFCRLRSAPPRGTGVACGSPFARQRPVTFQHPHRAST